MQAYLDNIKAKTGKSVDDFRALAAEKGLTKWGDVMAWLKADFDLGHGHATAMTHQILSAGVPETGKDEQIAALFAGTKAHWRPLYDALLANLTTFGADVEVAPTKSYISLLRGARKFAIAQPSATERFDLGIKLKGAAPAGRLEAAGPWNAMVTHRVRISDPAQVDAELLGWLKQAYEAA